MITLIGLAEFGEPIRCAREALGSVTPIQMGGLTGRFELPGFPLHIDAGKFLTQSPLTPPPKAAKLRRGDDLFYWGRPLTMPGGMSEVTRALLTFDIESENVESDARKVHFAFNAWRALFEAYVEVYTKQRAHRSISGEQDAAGLDLLAWNEAGDDVRPKLGSTGTIEVVLAGEKSALTRMQLQAILKLTSAGAPMTLEYELQLAAYRALRSADYRKAIIETAVVAEMLLTKVCRDALVTMGLGSPAKILDKFRTLGGRVGLAQVLGIGLPSSDLRTILVEPRNAVVHNGHSADRATAHAAVAATDQLLKAWQPLPSD